MSQEASDLVERLRPSYAADEAAIKAAVQLRDKYPHLTEALNAAIVANNALKSEAATALAAAERRAEEAERERDELVKANTGLFRANVDDLVKLRAAESRATALQQRLEQVEEAVEAAGYYIDRLRTAHAGRPVRDMEEAGEAYYRLAGIARTALEVGNG